MANLKEVKGRISSVTSTQQMTQAMKMVAAAKLRRAQNKIAQMRPYAQKLSEIVQHVSPLDGEMENPYTAQRRISSVLLVVVSSDRGLCGAFNSSVFKHTKGIIAQKYGDVEDANGLEILPIGKKAYEYFKKRRYLVNDTFCRLLEKLNFDEARKAAKYVMDRFEDGRWDQVEIIYNEFKNVATQKVQAEPLLPIRQVESRQEVAKTEYIYEPSQHVIFHELAPKSLETQFYKAVLESNASEQGARMTAMSKATDNADELLKELRLTYNRTRQAAITKEILEIVGGAEALEAG